MKQIVITATVNGPVDELDQEDLACIGRAVQTEVYSVVGDGPFRDVNVSVVADGKVATVETSHNLSSPCMK